MSSEREKLVMKDELTQLSNKRAYKRGLERCLDRAEREDYTEEGKAVALVYMDFNNFKQLNDKYGHKSGDEALAILGKALRKCTRSTDLAARIGGDEFVLIVDPIETEYAEMFLCSLSDRVNNHLRKEMKLPKDAVKPSVSLGMAIYNKDSPNAEELEQHADQAMYKAKNSAKRLYCLFQKIN